MESPKYSKKETWADLVAGARRMKPPVVDVRAGVMAAIRLRGTIDEIGWADALASLMRPTWMAGAAAVACICLVTTIYVLMSLSGADVGDPMTRFLVQGDWSSFL